MQKVTASMITKPLSSTSLSNNNVDICTMIQSNLMSINLLGSAKVTHPTGDPEFSVMQAFPAIVSAEEADPFLMCDHFGPMLSTGNNE